MDPLHTLIESLSLNEGYGKNVEAVVRKLKRVHSIDDMKYAIQEMVASGLMKLLVHASRSVYTIDDDYILKAMDSQWLMDTPNLDQNRNESNPAIQEILGDYMPRIVARGPKYRWMIVEKAVPLKWHDMPKWMKAVGLEHTSDLDDLKRAFVHMAMDQRGGQDPTPEQQELQENDLTKRLFELYQHHGVALDDFVPKNLGWSLDGKPMILDIGLGL